MTRARAFILGAGVGLAYWQLIDWGVPVLLTFVAFAVTCWYATGFLTRIDRREQRK